MKEIRIGILGFGTVGTGVVEGLIKQKDLISSRTNIIPIIVKVSDKNLTRKRDIKLPKNVLTTDSESVITDPSIDLIVELVGGTTIAKDLVVKALSLGKPVITANKALLAKYGEELYSIAKKNNAGIYYEAAVGGGIPLLSSLRNGLVGNSINEIYGILNGTCNFILSRMEEKGLPFNVVLKEAQKLGYAETPPDLDVNGDDTAHKAIILASMAYGVQKEISFNVRGITDISEIDITYVNDLGYRIKLLAIIKKHNDKIELSVEPTLVPKKHMISSVNDSFNAVFIRGDIVGNTMFYGRGAGRLPTGSAVISDIMEAARDKLNNFKIPTSVTVMQQDKKVVYILADDVKKRCYIRLFLNDKPGAMAKIMSILANNNINVASVIQKEHHPENEVPVVILTEFAYEHQFEKALNSITNSTDWINNKPIRLRIEDFEDESC